MRRSYRVSSLIAFAIAAVAFLAATAEGEEIVVVAGSDVPLYDPTSMAGPIGTTLRTVGVLSAGSSAGVVKCDPRKSDIDILVQFNGTTAVLGGQLSEVRLHRTRASVWAAGVTSTCIGFFQQASAPTTL